jgi:hypothetical protein
VLKLVNFAVVGRRKNGRRGGRFFSGIDLVVFCVFWSVLVTLKTTLPGQTDQKWGSTLLGE